MESLQLLTADIIALFMFYENGHQGINSKGQTIKEDNSRHEISVKIFQQNDWEL